MATRTRRTPAPAAGTARLVPNGRSFDGHKRQAVPYDVEWTCPTCGKARRDPVHQDLVCGPDIGESAPPTDLRVCCHDDAHIYHGRIPVRLTLVATPLGPLVEDPDWYDD